MRLTPLSVADYRRFVHQLTDLAQQTDRGIVLAATLIALLRQQRIIMPAVEVIERVCSEALTHGTRLVYEALSADHRSAIDGLLSPREGTKGSSLIWLRQAPGPPKPKHVLVHLERLKAVRDRCLPDSLERTIHQNRLQGLPGPNSTLTLLDGGSYTLVGAVGFLILNC